MYYASHYEKTPDPIIGKKVKHVYMDDDNLTIETEDGEYLCYTVCGDCCSHSYFHEVMGAEKIIGKTIVSVEDTGDVLPMDGRPNKNDSEEVQQYGVRFSASPETTDVAGHPMETSVSMVVEFRNSSNGYYGGSLCFPTKIGAPIGTLII